MAMSMSDDFLKYEIEQILSMQDKFQGIECVLEVVSEVFNPINAQFVVGPLLTALNGESMVETLVAMTLSDYASIVMKWIVRENRPFWWVKETPLYSSNDRPKLRQHRLTCETTPGGPSSHANIITIIVFFQGRWLIKYLQKKTALDHDLINSVVFVGVSSIIVLTWISRSYFGAHFPHQCVSGTTLALSVMSILDQDDVRKEIFRADKKRAMGFLLALLMAVGSVYFGMIKMGIDPMWSVRMAFKWCESIEYLKPETTPVYSIVKNLGSAFGIALCAPLKKRMSRSSNPWKSFPVTVGFIVLNTFMLGKAPKDKGSLVFLLATFMTSLFHAYALIELVPKITHWWDNTSPRPPSLSSIQLAGAQVRKLPRMSDESAIMEADRRALAGK